MGPNLGRAAVFVGRPREGVLVLLGLYGGLTGVISF